MTEEDKGFSIKFCLQSKKPVACQKKGCFDGQVEGFTLRDRVLNDAECNLIKCVFEGEE